MPDKPQRIHHSKDVYSDGEFDRAFSRTLGSNWQYIATRVAMMIVVYWLLARAINQHNLTPSFLLLPFAVEVLMMCLVGFFLSRTIIDCPAFRQTSGHGGWAFFATLIFFLAASGVVVSDNGSVDLARFVPGWRAVGQTVVHTGLNWVIVAAIVGLLLATFPEVKRWRQVGGKFVWTSIFDLSLRLAVLVLLLFVGVFILPLFSIGLGGWLEQQPNGESWLVFGFLLVLDVGGLGLAVKIHRSLAAQQQSAFADPNARVSPRRNQASGS